jgi:hypothetical protein
MRRPGEIIEALRERRRLRRKYDTYDVRPYNREWVITRSGK